MSMRQLLFSLLLVSLHSSNPFAMKLSTSALPKIKNKVRVPSYDRAALKPGILHLGVGNFHRSHMAAYFDDLFEKDFNANKDWGIVGAGILSFDADKRALLEPQQWLQTLVQQDADSVKASVLGSMIDFLPVQVAAIQEFLTNNPGIRIVSMTVTEGGYFLNDGKFDTAHPQVKHDIDTFGKELPQTIFGIIVQALKERKDNGQAPFTIMSCDNIPHNGNVVREAVLGMASAIDAELAKWIDETVGFPNSMVDRITPGTTNEQRKFVLDEFGYEDASPIFCEPFRQWVLEDKFSNGRPDLDQLENVKFVDDVTPYEFMKIRILNGGHASLCYPSALLGLPYVHKAMEHSEAIAPFLDALEKNEIIPSVPPVPDTDLLEYWKIISGRFSNPILNDTIGRNCFDGASRQPKFIIPVIKDNLAAGRSVDGLALVCAMWCHYCQGKTEAGVTIEPNDPQWDRLQATGLKAVADPPQWLAMTDIYGEVGTNPAFMKTFTKALNKVEREGVEAAMKEYVAAVASSS